ncbi:MAG: Rv0361 family membrane protein [Mycobacteriaceae bacterium]
MTDLQQPGPDQAPGGTEVPPQGSVAPVEQPKKRTRLIVGISVAVVAVLVLGGILIFALSGSSSSPREVADTFMSAIKDQDATKAKSVACAAKVDQLTSSDDFKVPDGYKIETFDYTFDKDDTAAQGGHDLSYKVAATVTYQGKTANQNATFKITTVKENDTWKVCDFTTD